MVVKQQTGKEERRGTPRLQGSSVENIKGPLPAQSDPVWRLWEFIRDYRWRIAIGCACGIIVSVIMLGNAYIIKQILKAMQERDVPLMTLCALSTPLIFVTKGIFYYWQVYFLNSVIERMSERLRNRLYEHMQALSLSFFEGRKTGGLVATIASDVPVIQQNLATALMEGISGPVIVVGGVAYMVYLNWRLAIAVLVSLFLTGGSISLAGQRMRRAGDAIQKSLSNTSALATEAIAAIRVVRSFGMEEHEAGRFREESHRTYCGNIRVARINAILKPIAELMGALSIAFIFWYGGLQIAKGDMGIEDVTALLFVTNLIMGGIQQIGRLKMYRERLFGAARRVFTVLDILPEIEDPPDAVTLEHVEGRIIFDDVHFNYADGESVLRGVSFEAQPGEALALVGPSGAGKTTIANLIPRFYDVAGGGVRVDGLDVRAVTTRSLRAHIGIVAQETILFSGSVRDNIAYGRPDASDDEIFEAARAANAHDFIMQSLPEGYATVVGERGVKLSGGQRQRIAIARAILKDPRILILDEATSALDAESEALVQEALDKLMRGRTTIIIAHRLSTVRKADRILVLARGTVQEQGTHTELLRKNGLYARLYEVGFGTDDAVRQPGRGALPGSVALNENADENALQAEQSSADPPANNPPVSTEPAFRLRTGVKE